MNASDPQATLQLLADYKQAAETTSDPDPNKANTAHDKMHACYKLLRASESGRIGVTKLMGDRSPQVRLWAAAHSLAWFPEAARSVLAALVNSDGPCSFDARITLEEFENGTLTFDY